MTKFFPSKMAFYGRKLELQRFEAFLTRSNALLAVVYGRRRIGKSALIKEVLKQSGVQSVYLECRQTSEADHVAMLSELISQALRMPGWTATSVEALLDSLAQFAVTTPFILVLDEYPYLRDLIDGCDSILQGFVDRWKGRTQLKLVLCGSYIDVMKGVIEHQSPLYGRAGFVLEVKPLDYFEASSFYPEAPLAQRVGFYSLFGGIPYYNELIDPTLSVRENVLALLEAEAAVLSNEIGMFLRAELSKLNNANLVLLAIAQGARKFSDILAQTRIAKSPTLAEVLDRLMTMGMIVKEAPINEENNKRRAIYRIADPLADFYYQFVYRHASQLHVLSSAQFYKLLVEEAFETQFVPKAFESICKQYLIRCNRAGRIDPPFLKIGRYYYDLPKEKRNGEFDIVTEDSTGYVFYEAKFRRHAMTRAQIDAEIAQVRASPLSADRFGFFSRSGFDEDVERSERVRLYTLEDIYAPIAS